MNDIKVMLSDKKSFFNKADDGNYLLFEKSGDIRSYLFYDCTTVRRNLFRRFSYFSVFTVEGIRNLLTDPYKYMETIIFLMRYPIETFNKKLSC